MRCRIFFIAVTLFISMFSVSFADSSSTPTKFKTPGTPFLRAALNFFDAVDTGNQTLSVVVVDNSDNLIVNATVNGTVIAPDGTQTRINFTEISTGNYTNNFTFNAIGYYTVGVSINRTDYDNITGSKTIYVGLVEFTAFSGSDVFQSTTAFFDLTTKNKGNVSSLIVPVLKIKTLSGTLVFSRTGFASTLTANQTVPLLQRNTLIWSVGSTAADTYNATAHINFTDTNNVTRQTPERSFLFQVKSQETTTTSGGGSVSVPGGGTTTIVIIKEINESVENIPTKEFIEFSSIPILVETSPGNLIEENIVAYNPTTEPINDIKISIDGIPENWYFLERSAINDIESESSYIVSLFFSIPGDALPGNYQGRIVFRNEQLLREYYFILRINPTLPVNVVISKVSKVNEVKSETNFVIFVKAKRDMESISVIENINKDIAESIDDIEFSIPPTRIIQPDPIVEWIFNNLRNGEEKNITYYIKRSIKTTKPFVFSSIEQVTTIEKATLPEAEINLYDIIIILLLIIIISLIIIIYRSIKARPRGYAKEKKIFYVDWKNHDLMAISKIFIYRPKTIFKKIKCFTTRSCLFCHFSYYFLSHSRKMKQTLVLA